MPSTASEYFDRGVDHYESDRFEQAISDFDAAIDADPGFYPAYHNRALAKCELEQYAPALEDMEVVIRNNPDDAEAYCNRGYILVQSGAPAAALRDLDTAVNMGPENAAALVIRGMARFQLQHIKMALSDFGRAIAADPDNADAYRERAGIWNSLGDYPGAGEDYNAAIDRDPAYALAYLYRGRLYAGPLGEKTLASADLNRFLALATEQEFSANSDEIFDFFSKTPAPFLLRRVLLQFAGFDSFPNLPPVVDEARVQCRPMQLYLKWLNLQQMEQRDPLDYQQILTIVHFYMGDPAETYWIAENNPEDAIRAGVPLNLMGLYYLIESAKSFHEPCHAVLRCVLDEIRSWSEASMTQKDLRDRYYAGLILYNNARFVEADDFFANAEAYLPAAYMHIRTMQAMSAEPEHIAAKIARLRAREAALSPEQGFLQGFPTRFFKPDSSDQVAPLLHYAHYREIQDALAMVRTEGASVAPEEIWTAFQWAPETLGWVEWMIRREELSALGKQLSGGLRSIEKRYLADNRADELIRLGNAFSQQLEQDNWAVTLHEKYDDFQRTASLLPDLRRQLAALISREDPLALQTQIQLIEYFCLRGNLPAYEAFLMYFYVVYVQATPQFDSASVTDLGEKAVEWLFDPLRPAGETLSAATTSTLVSRLNIFLESQSDAGAKDGAQSFPDYETFSTLPGISLF